MRLLADIVSELDTRAKDFEIGSLQASRAKIKGLKRTATRLFGNVNHPDWAHHHGGREELQFNVGYEGADSDAPVFRHGVAFSFEPSRSMPDIETLSAKVPRFNEFLQSHMDELADFEMWHYDGQTRSQNYPVSCIPERLVKLHTFIGLGRTCGPEQIDLDLVLRDFDRLLPLYLATEGKDVARADANAPGHGPVVFRAGCARRVEWTSATQIAKTISVSLRHAAIQQALYDRLVVEFGKDNVGTENQCLAGGRVDVSVRRQGSLALYEIKTSSTARGCIREALGQLFDYAFWPTGAFVSGLYVVGEPPLTADASSYLARLNERLPVPLGYVQVAPAD